jgi:hypothetical protein
MQNRQNGRRRRGGGGNNNPRPMGQPMGGQSANRLEVRVRGNAHQLLEKYKQLARDAHQAGDRVASEYYLQHSDHYFRVLNDSRIRQEEMRARRGVFDQFDDEPVGPDGDAVDGGEDNGEAGRNEGGRNEGGRSESGRGESGRGERAERGERPERAERAERPERAERIEGQERPRRWQERRSERSRDADEAAEAPAAPQEVLELRMSDGEAALVAFGGAPAREAAEDAEAEAPKPRRRGRPRKTAEPVDG